MSNKYTQDMTGLGTHVELPDDPGPEPERYYDWMLWKLRQDPKGKETMSTNKTSLSDGVENTLFAFKPRLKMVAKKILGGSSLTLAAIYTLGHVIIAMAVVSFMTGASLWEAGSVALVEPAINGVWFYVLHSLWKKFS